MEGNIEETDPNYMEYALKKSLLSRNKLAIILKNSAGQKQYCCVECPARYLDKDKLELHLCVHNKEYKFLCGICGTGLKRKEHLDRHTQEHQEVRPHVCKVCGKGFKRREHLNIHKTIHNEDKGEVCYLCRKSFHRKDHLQKHLQTHNVMYVEQDLSDTVQEIMDIKAEILDEDEQPSISGIKLEYDAEYLERDPLDYNVFDANLSDAAKREAAQHLVTVERPFVCEICFKSYKRKDHLKIHSWTHMTKDKICSACGKAFHLDEQLLLHTQVCIQFHLKQNHEEILTEEGNPFILDDVPEPALLVQRSSQEVRPHVCHICGRRFKRKQHLKVHANVHLKPTEYSQTIWCSECNEGFHEKYHFENHQCPGANMKQNKDPSSSSAPDAKKENDNPSQFLELEMTEPDVELGLPVPQKVYVCKYCGKPFKRKDHYKIHLHIHTGVKSYFCQLCGKGFYRKDHLQKHALVHLRQKLTSAKQKLDTQMKQAMGMNQKEYNNVPKKQLPDLFPIKMISNTQDVKPEITIHAPNSAKLRVPLQIKVPYQMVVSGKTVTVNPRADADQHEDTS